MSALNLSAEGQQFFCGLAIAGAGVMAGGIGVPIAAGLIEFATNGGNLALAVAREKQDRCQKLLDGVVRSVEESYQAAWKQNRAGSARDEIEAAFAQLDAALVAIKPTPQEIVNAGFNGRKLYTALKAKLPASSLFQQSHAAEEVLSKIITGTYALIRSDQAFAAEFQNLGFERVLTVLDGMDGKLDDLLRGQLEAKLDRHIKHEEQMAAIAERNGIPLENLEPVFQALEVELPQGSSETLIGVLTERIEAIKARGENPVERLNDPVEVVAAIEAARAKLNQLDTEGALEGLRAARMEQAEARKARARGEARLAMEEAAILELGFRWDEALDVYAQAATLNPDDISPHILSGVIRTHRGNLDGAEVHFRDALDVAGRAGGDREQMIANGMRADNLIAQGNLDAAASHQAVMIEAAERLASQDASNAEWQRDLSVSHNKIGDVESARGNLEVALAAFKASLAIHERLASQDASNAEWQRDLSVSHNKIGDVESARGNLEAALAAFKASLAIRERLASQDASNAQWQRDLSVSHERIGDVESARGNLQAALAAFKAGLAIAERLASQDASNTEWQRDLSVSHERIGNVESARGNLEAALAAFKAGLAIAERLASQDASNAQWQRDLSVSHNKIGDVEMARSNLEAALAAFKAGLAIRERLASQDASNAEWQRDLIVSNVKLAEYGDEPASRYKEALRIAHDLLKTGRLAPVDHWMVEDLEKRLAQAST